MGDHASVRFVFIYFPKQRHAQRLGLKPARMAGVDRSCAASTAGHVFTMAENILSMVSNYFNDQLQTNPVVKYVEKRVLSNRTLSLALQPIKRHAK